ncbi:MAG: choice-of-anchor Q domain-containing protein, partial [Rhodothermales bacterium]|nr:choice-of-anchor Q domain-containing protein [Rhodothermales bacterium]
DGFTVSGGNADGAGPAGNGGGLYCEGSGSGGGCSPTLSNVAFTGNAASNRGGAMYNSGDFLGVSSPVLTNVTVAGNVATSAGGAVYNSGYNSPSSPVFNNVILWSNSATDGAQIYNSSATPTLSHTLIEGGLAGIFENNSSTTDGGGNLSADPAFVDAADPAGPDGLFGTGDDGLRLVPGSPAIDAGDATLLPADSADLDDDGDTSESLPFDCAGNARVLLGTVDLGAYEQPFGPPVAAFQPDLAVGLSATLPRYGTTLQTLTLSNTGDSDLTFDFTAYSAASRSGASRPAFTSGPASGPGGPAALQLDKGEADPRPGSAPRRGGDSALGRSPAGGHRATGGPDAFGYRWTDSTDPDGPAFAFVDVAPTGTPLAGLGDDAAGTCGLPFSFPFYGEDRSAVWVSSNGFLAFAPEKVDAHQNDPLPSASAPHAVIAPYWDDLDPSAAGAVYCADLGDGRFVVQWDGVPFFSGVGTRTFQAVLYEDGRILFQYDALDFSGQEGGASIGIEDGAGAAGLGVAFNSPYAVDGLSVIFEPGTPAFVSSVSPASGTVAPGAAVDVVVAFDATGHDPGTYASALALTTNEGGGGAAYEVPVALEITPDACETSFAAALTLTDSSPTSRSTTLVLGTVPGGSDDYDVGCDQTLPGTPGADVFYAAFRGLVSGSAQDYRKDFRAEVGSSGGDAPFHIWEATVTGGVGDVTMEWAAPGEAPGGPLSVPAGTQLILLDPAGAFEPVDLSDAASFTLPSGTTDVWVLLTTEATYARVFPWNWSMFGLSLAPSGSALYSDVLDPAPSQAPLAFDDGAYYELTELTPEQGVWTFYFQGGSTEPGPGTATVSGYLRPYAVHTADETWELAAFPACDGAANGLAVDELVMSPAGGVLGELYTWDDGAGAYATVSGSDPLEAGRAYWLFRVAASDVTVTADCRDAAGGGAGSATNALAGIASDEPPRREVHVRGSQTRSPGWERGGTPARSVAPAARPTAEPPRSRSGEDRPRGAAPAAPDRTGGGPATAPAAALVLTVADGLHARDLLLGLDPEATDAFDPAFDRPSPPAPPAGLFDAR